MLSRRVEHFRFLRKIKRVLLHAGMRNPVSTTSWQLQRSSACQLALQLSIRRGHESREELSGSLGFKVVRSPVL